jgi:hypothetical protein
VGAHHSLVIVIQIFAGFELCSMYILLVSVSNETLLVVINDWFSSNSCCIAESKLTSIPTLAAHSGQELKRENSLLSRSAPS